MQTLDQIEAEKLENKLIAVVQKGYANDYERNEKEINCIALPIFEKKRLVAAVGISGPAFRFTEEENS